jgi:hypothetical protein
VQGAGPCHVLLGRNCIAPEFESTNHPSFSLRLWGGHGTCYLGVRLAVVLGLGLHQRFVVGRQAEHQSLHVFTSFTSSAVSTGLPRGPGCQMKSREQLRRIDDRPYLVSPPIIRRIVRLLYFLFAMPESFIPSASMDD